MNTPLKSLILLAVGWTITACAGGGPSKAIPNAQLNSQSIGEHVAAATGHVGVAIVSVNRGLAIVDDMQAGKLTVAIAAPLIRQELVKTNAELTATQTELTATQDERGKLDASLATAQKNLASETARADTYEHKYKTQWFAGKFWATFWVVVIGGAIVALLVIFLNIKTDLFVIPFQQIGKWVSDIIGGTVRAFWNVCVGVWKELASLLPKKAAPNRAILPTMLAQGWSIENSTPTPAPGSNASGAGALGNVMSTPDSPVEVVQ